MGAGRYAHESGSCLSPRSARIDAASAGRRLMAGGGLGRLVARSVTQGTSLRDEPWATVLKADGVVGLAPCDPLPLASVLSCSSLRSIATGDRARCSHRLDYGTPAGVHGGDRAANSRGWLACRAPVRCVTLTSKKAPISATLAAGRPLLVRPVASLCGGMQLISGRLKTRLRRRWPELSSATGRA